MGDFVVFCFEASELTNNIQKSGNYESPLDILTKMFVEKKVVVYKSHPNLIDSTGPFLEKVFAKLIKNGFLAIVEGAVAPATTIIESDSVDELLMTGGAATYDRIMVILLFVFQKNSFLEEFVNVMIKYFVLLTDIIVVGS